MSRRKRRKNTPGPSPIDEEIKSGPWTSQDRAWLAGLLALAASVYTMTMWPNIAGGDSGELTAAACTLGIVHPPGYPLFTMLGYVFSQIPFGSVGWRVNLLSVACGLGTLTFLFLILRRLTRTGWLAFSVSGLIAFSPLVWRYSIAAEVFALNNLFALALLYGMVRAIQDRNERLVYLLAFLFGLGLSNHHTLIFIGAPAGLYLLWHFRSRFLRPGPLLLVFLLFFLGMTPYAYLYWASSRVPLIAWGDITSWSGFMTHLLRKEYGTFNLATEGSNKFQLFWGLYFYLLNLGQTFGYLGLAAVFYGIWRVLKRPSSFEIPGGRIWILLPLLYLIVFHSLANLPFVEGASLYRDIVSRFWLMPNLIFAVPGVLGFVEIYGLASESQKKFLKAVMIASPFVAVLIHHQSENHRDNRTFAEFGRYLLDQLPQNAVFFSLGDINTNTVRYVQNCEGYRQDVKVMDRSLMSYPWFKRIVERHYPDVILPGSAYHPKERGAYDFKRLFDANFRSHQIYMTTLKAKDSNEAVDKAWESQYRFVPYGLTLKVQSKDQAFDIDQYIADSEKALVDPLQKFPNPPLPDSWDAVILANYWLAHHTRAAEILRHALRTQERKYFLIAEGLLENLVAKNPKPPADYYKNLGIAHQHLGRLSEGDEKRRHETRMLEVWEVFVRKTDRRDKTWQDIQSVLKAYGR